LLYAPTEVDRLNMNKKKCDDCPIHHEKPAVDRIGGRWLCKYHAELALDRKAR
jgi:hypothetical protein